MTEISRRALIVGASLAPIPALARAPVPVLMMMQGAPALSRDAALVASMPSGLVALWSADTYSATPQPNLPNLVAPAAPVSANLFRGGPNQSGVYWGKIGLTTTDFQAGPDGSTLNATQVNGTGNWYYYYNLGTFLPGTYTLAFEAKSATGSNRTFKSAFLSQSTSAVKTATTSWQTFTFTATWASGNSGSVIALWSPDGSTAGNILVANLRLFPGSADLGPDTAASSVGHLLFGTSPAAGVPVVSGGMMNMTNAAGMAMFNNVSLSAFTAVAIAQKNTAGGGAGYQGFLSKGATSADTSPYGEFTAYFERSADTNPSSGGFINDSAGLWELYNKGWHFLAHSQGPSGASFYLDDLLFASSSTAFPSTSFNSLLVGALNTLGSFPSNYNIASIALFNRVLSSAEIASVRAALAARAAKSGINLGTERIYAAEGNSITAMASYTYPHLFGPNANPPVLGSVFAVSGSGIADMVRRAPNVDAQIPASPGSRKFILSVMIGRNDLSTGYSGPGGTGIAGWLTDLAAYLDARRAKGWKVVLCTILPATAGGFNAARDTANATLRTWVGVHCDAIADMASDPTMGIDGDGSTTGPWNTTYYADGTHPTNAGQVLLEPYLRAAVNGL